MNKVKIFDLYTSPYKLQEAINEFIASSKYCSRYLVNVSLSTHVAGYTTHYNAAVVYNEKENS
jgi:hypothetical protein